MHMQMGCSKGPPRVLQATALTTGPLMTMQCDVRAGLSGASKRSRHPWLQHQADLPSAAVSGHHHHLRASVCQHNVKYRADDVLEPRNQRLLDILWHP